MEKKVKDIEKEVETEVDDEYEEVSVEERVIEIEKKVNIILIIVGVTALLSLFTLIFSINNNGNEELGYSETTQTQTSGYDTSAFKEITAQDIATESKSETIVVWIGRQGCGYCAQYAPNITEAAEDFGIQLRYIDMGKWLSADSEGNIYISDKDSYNTVAALTGSGEWKEFAKENVGGTPLTLIIKNNKVVGGLQQAETVENIEKAFTDAGLKK